MIERIDESIIAITVMLALLGLGIIIQSMNVGTKKKSNKDILGRINGE